ncbi:MAG: three-Cys-motif partner protein TcmP, partial [Clostridiales bacterium]|nr:three-Cys-motif partner protein TcmP [Clostridiales bacterium]
DNDRSQHLYDEIKARYPEKINKVTFITGDANIELKSLLSKLTVYQRGVMFLDPYAMELNWDVLESAKQSGILDIWYLFPLNALTRNLFKKLNMPEATKEKVTRILGTDSWEKELYHQSAQLSFFDDEPLERVNFDGLVDFVKDRLKSNFPYVSPKSRMLKNSNNSPMFILFFIMTNASNKAIGLGSKVVSDIFDKLDKMSSEVG